MRVSCGADNAASGYEPGEWEDESSSRARCLQDKKTRLLVQMEAHRRRRAMSGYQQAEARIRVDGALPAAEELLLAEGVPDVPEQ